MIAPRAGFNFLVIRQAGGPMPYVVPCSTLPVAAKLLEVDYAEAAWALSEYGRCDVGDDVLISVDADGWNPS